MGYIYNEMARHHMQICSAELGLFKNAGMRQINKNTHPFAHPGAKKKSCLAPAQLSAQQG